MSKSNVIVDVGVSNGNDTDFYLKKGFKVFGIEGDPIVCGELESRFSSQISTGQLELVPAVACSANDEEISFFVNESVQAHSKVAVSGGKSQQRKGSEYMVKTINWPAIHSRTGPVYYCKIDIEGGECEFLESFEKATLPKYVSAECHTIDPIRKLNELGYRKYKLINQCILFQFPIPQPAKEGFRLPDHKFQHASGFFGEELPGDKWYTYAEILDIYETIKQLKSVGTLLGKGVWFDIHATQ